MRDLHVHGVLMTFDQLCERYQIPKKPFFKYLQLKSFMSSKSKQIICIPTLSKLEEATLANLEGKGHLSRYYNLLRSHSKDGQVECLER